MREPLKRVQMLITNEQHRELSDEAAHQGMSVSELTRRVIDLGLSDLRQKDEFDKREHALHDAEELRKKMRQRRGVPLDIDIVSDISQVRWERDDQLSSRSN